MQSSISLKALMVRKFRESSTRMCSGHGHVGFGVVLALVGQVCRLKAVVGVVEESLKATLAEVA